MSIPPHAKPKASSITKISKRLIIEKKKSTELPVLEFNLSSDEEDEELRRLFNNKNTIDYKVLANSEIDELTKELKKNINVFIIFDFIIHRK